MAEALVRCSICFEDFPPAALTACTLCARQTCHACGLMRGGHFFCGKRCADADFFSGLDDESGQGGEE